MNTAEPASLSAELASLARWVPTGDAAHLHWFRELIVNEFLSFDEQHAREAQALRATVSFAAMQVPYYRRPFSQLSLSSTEIGAREDLTKLPILSKEDLIVHAPDMVAEPLPDGEDARTNARTSGSTGRPVKVVVSRLAQLLYAVLWHRQARWFGLEPEKAIGELRLASQLPLDAQGQVLGRGAEANLSNWRYLGRLFRTGPQVCFALSNSYEAQLAWLERHRPAYLFTYPGSLEELAFEAPDRLPALGLKALISVGASATPIMERTIARGFGLALNQVYGLNEVGRVAVKCEHGRFHVHRESALVEIIDDDGHPCPPGERGRVIVTGLANFVMPLLRYDTGDIAQALSGPCACSPTLPTFGPVAGRFRRFAGLPSGTRERFQCLRQHIIAMHEAGYDVVRDSQAHQGLQDEFELRLLCARPLGDQFRGRIEAVWQADKLAQKHSLTIVEVGSLQASPSGKIFEFMSDFYPDYPEVPTSFF